MSLKRKDKSTDDLKVLVCSSVVLDYVVFLGRCLEGKGKSVELVYSIGESRYRALARGGFFARVWMRVLMYVLYPVKLALKVCIARQGTLVVVTSNTFFAPALASIVSFGRVRVIHVLYDLFPDALTVSGGLRESSWKFRLLGIIARANMRWPAAVVYLGRGLRAYADQKWGKARLGRVIEISTDTRLYRSQFMPEHSVPLQVHYGGQLGAMHDAESLAAAVSRIKSNPRTAGSVNFSFAVSGSRVKQFAELVRGLEVQIRPTVDSSVWRQNAEAMHIGLVSLSPLGAKVCLPSKTYAMMASGMAIIAICPKTCDLAHLVQEYAAGWVVDNAADGPLGANENQRTRSTIEARVGDEIEKIFEEIIGNPAELVRRRTNAHKAAHGPLGAASIEAKWSEFLAEVHAIGRH